MRQLVSIACLVCAALAAATYLSAADDAEDADFSAELPRIPPHEPADALTTFSVQPGFQIDQVAAEPLVVDPVAIDFDADGRAYVVCMVDYSEQDQEFLGQVRLLEDTDGDGHYDRSTLFADKLSWPTAVGCYDGGVFVGAAPDVYYLKDHDGDGQADERRTVYTGFARSNVQGLLNSFRWGLDNRLHLATSSTGGAVVRADDPQAQPITVNGRDIAINPRTLEIQLTSGAAQHGMSFDDWGRKFVSSNSDHIQQVMYEDRYVARNPYLSAPGPRISIAADGPQAEVYRTSPVEPWRIVRTRLRVSGAVPGIVEGGGRAAGYFTGATGVTIYRGDAWPAEFHGLAIVGDVGSNLVHRKRLESNGLEFIARRIDEQSEFVSSNDIWFRPCQFANAPDGTLYILDVYREVIEHPASLPPVIKRHLDLTSGRDRGRLYRVLPDDYEQRPVPKLSQATTAELVALLAHPNAWHRETAARLLYERQDQSAGPLLARLAEESPSALGRMHALYALSGLGALSSEHLLPRLHDEQPEVRAHAVRLSESLANDSADLLVALLQLVNDPSLLVRYQLAFTLGELRTPARLPALAALAQQDASDPWIRLAIHSSLANDAGEVCLLLCGDPAARSQTGVRELLAALAVQVGRQQSQEGAAFVLQAVNQAADEDSSLAELLVRSYSEGLAASGATAADALDAAQSGQAEAILQGLLQRAQATAIDDSAEAADRASAIRTLGLANYADVAEALPPLLDQRQPADVQLAALQTLARFDAPEVAEAILGVWSGLSPTLRNTAAEALLSRPERVLALFDAIEAGLLQPRDIDAARWKLLLADPNEEIRRRAEMLAASLQLGRRAEIVEDWRDVLELEGDVDRGRTAFRKICVNCHRVEGQGFEIGPNLATVRNRGADFILVNVLDPSREVNPQYVNYAAITTDGRTLSGMIAAETATSITLRRAENMSDTLLRIDIDQLQSTGLSLMPEGVEKDLNKQALADIIAYLLAVP